MDFKVNVPCYSLHAWLNWRLNFEDLMQIHSAHLVPEPICNHVDIVHNDHDVLNSHLDISNVQLIELPEDNLLDHMPALAAVDGIPGFQAVLAPLNAEPKNQPLSRERGWFPHAYHLDDSIVQLVDIPTDNLLDHPPALAEVDGIPGSQPLLAVPLACTHGDLAVASNSSLPHAEAID